ncbi:PREDICTED: uncharacterized protein LOC104598044 [Nelumbo nucifera]|uniref:Son of sevenless n=2 Tax=Nelumbo nucifera TaxID=4432 RepID=A0A822YIN1_NELNU|nr:PREDICTED: uncharacterized protein LOC104598044 [Nelumbo nucifera]DAD31351.1 TPA_asm: hypothetical protein HUJ06_010202 [Nelumbo nucifera]
MKMEVSCEHSCKIDSELLNDGSSEVSHLQSIELESTDTGIRRSLGSDQQFHSMGALEILRETVRILRYNSPGFMMIAAVLICPVSAVVLSNVLVDHSILKRLSTRLLLVAKSSGLPLDPSIKQSCQRLSNMALSAAFCFPFYITLLLLSKSAIVYSVDCTYSRKKFNISKFFAFIVKIWKRPVSTYVWACMVIVGCLALFLLLMVAICNMFFMAGFPSTLLIYPAIMVGLVFSILFANAIIICNLAIVISVLEDVSGPQALLRSSVLIQGQTQVGLMIFLGSTMGMAFVEGLYEHRVKTLSYGDGSSRIWEGPLLVIMYSFVVLMDSMMNAVFYFTCRSSSIEALEGEHHTPLEVMDVPSGSADIQ